MLVDKSSNPIKVPRMGKKEQRWNDPSAHKTLKKIYDERVLPTGKSQEQFGADYGIGTQGMVWQYLSGTTPLSLEAAARFARGLHCTIQDISPYLAEQLRSEIIPVLAPKAWWKVVMKTMAIFLAISISVPEESHAQSGNWRAAVYYVISRLQILRTRFQQLRTRRLVIS